MTAYTIILAVAATLSSLYSVMIQEDCDNVCLWPSLTGIVSKLFQTEQSTVKIFEQFVLQWTRLEKHRQNLAKLKNLIRGLIFSRVSPVFGSRG